MCKLELARLKSERKATAKMEESDPTHESHHNIRDVEIEAVGEVEEEKSTDPTKKK